ncbi:MAG: hypothetical protein ABEI53_02515 [Candidatus Magasanikbacteria bacterium]
MAQFNKIGIIGVGYVGSTLKKWFENKENTEVFLYDKYKEIGSPKEVNKAEVIFVAVPTPYRKEKTKPSDSESLVEGYDDSAVRDAISNISEHKIVVIKSSVLPGSTEKFSEQNPNKTFLFNPEFLVQRTAWQDFTNPHRQIIGVTDKKSKKIAKDILDLLPDAPFEKIINSGEAEMTKFFSNTFLALRVVFANQMYDLCEKLDIDYEPVVECAGHDTRIGHSHFDVFHGEKRGYGGACLPKDTNSLLELANEVGADLELLEKMREINEKLRNES